MSAHPGASRWLGLALIGASVLLAGVLMFMPAPSHLPTLLCGLAVVTACGNFFLARGMKPWTAGVLLLPVVGVAGVVLAARSASLLAPAMPLWIQAGEATCALDVRGDLTSDLYRRLKVALDRAPGTRALLLSSAGGTAVGITHVASLLHARGVDTVVMHDQCDSACAFLWVAARHRVLAGRNDTLAAGFHAPHVAIPWFGPRRAPLQDLQQRHYLRQAGLPEAFIGWAYAPVNGLWRPDARHLNGIGVPVTFIRTDEVRKLSFCAALT